MPPLTQSDDLYRSLVEAVGTDHVLIDPELMTGYAIDVTGHGPGTAAAVVRPGSVEQVQMVLASCHRFGHPVVPQGGNTGLVGGSIPHHGEIVLSLRRLDRMDTVDVVGREVTVGAGVTIGALQKHARSAGLNYGVDLAARDSATIGGTIATNAGGLGVVANGDTRQQVLGLQVVFADGTVATRLSGVEKQSVGPDLMRLLIGSEGSLGVITAARVRLVPAPAPDRYVTLVGLETLAAGLALLRPGVGALEFFDRTCLEVVVAHRNVARPLPGDTPFYVLVESDTPPDLTEDAVAVVDRRLWNFREAIPDIMNTLHVSCKLDVALPLDRMDEFVAAVQELDFDGDRYFFGHLAEGNFHVNVVGSSDPARVADLVFGLVVEFDGAIASEHGIGTEKAAWWRQVTEPTLLAASRKVKDALDPSGILNPAVFWG